MTMYGYQTSTEHADGARKPGVHHRPDFIPPNTIGYSRRRSTDYDPSEKYGASIGGGSSETIPERQAVWSIARAVHLPNILIV